MLYVKLRRGQSIEKAISVLKKKVKESKLMLELKEREFYTKPSIKRREKRAKAKLRHKKNRPRPVSLMRLKKIQRQYFNLFFMVGGEGFEPPTYSV